jgi:serine/threonine protein kinase
MSAAHSPESVKEHRRSIGGYRVVRALGTGSRAAVWLGHSNRSADPLAVALKVIANADDASVALELAAYERARSPHVARLIDVCSGADSTVCFVLEWLGEGSLAVFVRQRRRVRAGEAVTVLVSVLRGILDVHAAGFAHNAIGPTNVLFDRTGRPVLISLGHASRLPPSYSPAAMHARGADWAQFLGIVDLVLDRVEVEGREAEFAQVRSAIAGVATATDEQAACDRAEDALYAFAQPAPLILHPSATPGAVHRAQNADGDVSQRQAGRHDERVGGRPSAGRMTVGRQAVGRLTSQEVIARTEAVLDAGPIRSLRTAIAPVMQRRRKQLVFGGLLACVVAVAGLAAIPPETQGPTEQVRAERSSANAPTRSTPTSTPRGTPRSAQKSSAGDAVTQDEPVAAVVALLASRDRCLAKHSLACLTLTDQDASPLLQTDSAAITAAIDSASGGKPERAASALSTSDASLIERTGDSALVELPHAQRSDAAAQPVSVLAIKGEHGWRLREIFAA